MSFMNDQHVYPPGLHIPDNDMCQEIWDNHFLQNSFGPEMSFPGLQHTDTVAQSQIGDLQPQIIVLIIGELGISNRDHIRVLELERGP